MIFCVNTKVVNPYMPTKYITLRLELVLPHISIVFAVVAKFV